jgi:hypothetical protein
MVFFAVLLLVVIAFLLAAPIIAWVRASKAVRLAREDQNQVRNQTARVFDLERAVQLLKNLLGKRKAARRFLKPRGTFQQ